jgi:selenocysteine-specific elongation factor
VHVLATAGHVDHGKSTLVRALTGMEPDRFEEERRRGLTIDLGFVWTELPGGDAVAFVDVPGHERFVGTMLAGVGPVPAVLFVVAADEGWMPQSGEHRDALAALGTRDGLLVVTRSDLADPAPALEQARARLAGTPLAGLTGVCVSATTGAGMERLRRELAVLVARLPTPDPSAPVRLWVDRAFTVRGAGTVVTGTLPAGRLRVGDPLVLEPGSRPVTVRGLQVTGRAVDGAVGVARVAVNLRGVPKETVERGDALVSPGRWLTSTVVDVRLHPVRPGEPVGRPPARAHLHLGGAAVPVQLRPLGSRPAADRDDAGSAAEDGGDPTARLTLSSPLPMRIGDRALLRDPGMHRIVAGLTVLDVRPPALARRGAAARRAAELAGVTGAPDAAAELARRGLVDRDELVTMGADPATLPGDVVTAGPWLLDRSRAGELAERLAALVAANEVARPLEPGLPLAAARRALDLPDARLVEALVDVPGLLDAPGLVCGDGRVRRADAARAGVAPELRPALDAVRADLTGQPFAAPDADRLTGLGLGSAQLAALVRAGELERIGPGIYLLPGAERAALEVLRGLADAEFTLSAARQALGTTRRVAVPLLELLARHGHTVRGPDGRHRLTR